MSESDSSENSEMNEMKDDHDVQNRLDDDENFPLSESDDDEDDAEEQDAEEESGEDEEEDEDIHEEESEQEDENDDEEAGVSGKSAWAESISKILGSKNTGVLSKAQTIENIEKKKLQKRKMTFEVVGADDNGIKVEDTKPDQETLDKILRKRKRREVREV